MDPLPNTQTSDDAKNNDLVPLPFTNTQTSDDDQTNDLVPFDDQNNDLVPLPLPNTDTQTSDDQNNDQNRNLVPSPSPTLELENGSDHESSDHEGLQQESPLLNSNNSVLYIDHNDNKDYLFFLDRCSGDLEAETQLGVTLYNEFSASLRNTLPPIAAMAQLPNLNINYEDQDVRNGGLLHLTQCCTEELKMLFIIQLAKIQTLRTQYLFVSIFIYLYIYLYAYSHYAYSHRQYIDHKEEIRFMEWLETSNTMINQSWTQLKLNTFTATISQNLRRLLYSSKLDVELNDYECKIAMPIQNIHQHKMLQKILLTHIDSPNTLDEDGYVKWDGLIEDTISGTMKKMNYQRCDALQRWMKTKWMKMLHVITQQNQIWIPQNLSKCVVNNDITEWIKKYCKHENKDWKWFLYSIYRSRPYVLMYARVSVLYLVLVFINNHRQLYLQETQNIMNVRHFDNLLRFITKSWSTMYHDYGGSKKRNSPLQIAFLKAIHLNKDFGKYSIVEAMSHLLLSLANKQIWGNVNQYLQRVYGQQKRFNHIFFKTKWEMPIWNEDQMNEDNAFQNKWQNLIGYWRLPRTLRYFSSPLFDEHYNNPFDSLKNHKENINTITNLHPFATNPFPSIPYNASNAPMLFRTDNNKSIIVNHSTSDPPEEPTRKTRGCLIYCNLIDI